jgi:phage/plasmid-associated DNA primase
MPSIPVDKFLDSTGLDKFINQGRGKGQFHYSVDAEDTILPCYKMLVIGKEDAGDRDVYDIVAEEPYSNFVANGIVTHNCNKLPRIKYADKAVWNRVRVIPFEATFCRPDGPNPAPETYEEQLRQKRFPMDKQFSKKIPNLIEALAWVLLQHRQKITTRVEPEKVRAATEIYRRQNDIYRQFIEESIAEDSKKYLSLTELYNLFKDWFKDSLPGQSLPNKNEIEEYFCKLWGSPEAGKKWRGYRQRTIQDDVEDGKAVVLTEDDLVVLEDE